MRDALFRLLSPRALVAALVAALAAACAAGPASGAESVLDGLAPLREAVGSASPGDVLTLAPGTYRLTRKLSITRPGRPDAPIVLRAAKPGDVTLEVDTEEAIWARAPHWRFENLVLKGVCAEHPACEHAFHVVGRASGVVITDTVMVDFNAHIKGNPERVDGVLVYPNDVRIERSVLTNLTPRQTTLPVTPIDVVGGHRWVIRDNQITDFEKALGNRTSYGAFLKGNSRDGLIEGNLVMCEYRHRGGVRIGLSLGGGGTADRFCEGGRCDAEHTGGVIRNNFVLNCPRDVGIYLNKARETRIEHNSVLATGGIDVRFPESTAVLRNNAITARIEAREGGTFTASDNVRLSKREAMGSLVGAQRGDYRLRPDARLLVGKAPALEDVPADYCGARRPGPRVDAGAMEHGAAAFCDKWRHLPKP